MMRKVLPVLPVFEGETRRKVLPVLLPFLTVLSSFDSFEPVPSFPLSPKNQGVTDIPG